jgi:hypothetical protein
VDNLVETQQLYIHIRGAGAAERPLFLRGPFLHAKKAIFSTVHEKHLKKSEWS